MGRRTTRHLKPATLDALLARVGECRQAAISVITEAPITGQHYAMAGKLVAALDDVAEAITGNRAHFHAPWHSTHKGPLG